MSIQKEQRKSGVRYRVRVRDSNRKQLSKTFKRKIDAERWEREQLLIREQIPEYQQLNMSFLELVELWLTHKVSKRSGSTRQRYRDQMRLYILPTFGEKLIHEILPQEVEFWFSKQQAESKRPLSNKTLNGILKTLKNDFNCAVQTHRLFRTPASAVEDEES